MCKRSKMKHQQDYSDPRVSRLSSDQEEAYPVK